MILLVFYLICIDYGSNWLKNINFRMSFGEIIMQPSEVKKSQENAENIDSNPQGIGDIVSVGTLNKKFWREEIDLFVPEQEDMMVGAHFHSKREHH